MAISQLFIEMDKCTVNKKSVLKIYVLTKTYYSRCLMEKKLLYHLLRITRRSNEKSKIDDAKPKCFTSHYGTVINSKYKTLPVFCIMTSIAFLRGQDYDGGVNI